MAKRAKAPQRRTGGKSAPKRKPRAGTQGRGVKKEKTVRASEQVERQLVATALEKIRAQKQPTARELGALKRYEQQQETERRWEYLRTTPKAIYREMSGRTPRVLIDQANLYGLPYPAGPKQPVDLTAVVKWLHDFLADNSAKLRSPDVDDPMLAGSNSPALERYRLARAQREELELGVRRDQLLPVDDLLAWYDSEVAGPIRRSLERLRKRFGQEAADLVLNVLEGAEASVGRRLRKKKEHRTSNEER
jgi:hypothetical protein